MQQYVLELKKMNFSEKIQYILSLIILLFLNQGVLSFDKNLMMVLLILVGAIWGIILIVNKEINVIKKQEIVYGGIYAAILLLYYIIDGDFYFFMNIKGIVSVMAIYIISRLYANKNNLIKKSFVYIIYIDILFLWIHTLILLPEYPELPRGITGGWFITMKDGSPFYAVATFAHCYALPPLVIYYFYKFLFNNDNKCLLIAMLLSVFVISGTFTISILLMCFGIAILLLMRMFDSIKNKKLFCLILVMLICTGLLVLPSLVEFLANAEFVSESLKIRFNELSLLINENKLVEGDITSRLEVYLTSIRGIVKHKGLFAPFSTADIGSHSTILDNIALSGVFSLFLFLYLAISSIKAMKNNRGYLNIALLIYYLLIMLLNPVLLPQIFMPIYILIPFNE